MSQAGAAYSHTASVRQAKARGTNGAKSGTGGRKAGAGASAHAAVHRTSGGNAQASKKRRLDDLSGRAGNRSNSSKKMNPKNTDARKQQAERQRRMKMRRRREAVNRTMMVITGILIVAAVFIYITRMGQIHELSKQANVLEAEITRLNEDKQFKEVELAAARNITRIKDEAIGRLGMVEPSEEQIRRIPIKGYLE